MSCGHPSEECAGQTAAGSPFHSTTRMDACSLLRPFFFTLVLQAARLSSAQETPTQDLTCQVGSTVTFSQEVPQKSNISNLILRSSSRGSSNAVATWNPEASLSILSQAYLGRVHFQEEKWAFKIDNLTKADGGRYEVAELGDSEKLLQRYILVVFSISSTAKKFTNGSCSISLECEAGAGAGTPVEYSWGPRLKGSALHVTLPPADAGKSYTCTATALGTQHHQEVTPYKLCSSATRTAGLLGGPALLLALLLRGLLL